MLQVATKGECISAIKTARVNNNEEYQKLQSNERECVEAHTRSTTGALYGSLLEVLLVPTFY